MQHITAVSLLPRVVHRHYFDASGADDAYPRCSTALRDVERQPQSRIVRRNVRVAAAVCPASPKELAELSAIEYTLAVINSVAIAQVVRNLCVMTHSNKEKLNYQERYEQWCLPRLERFDFEEGSAPSITALSALQPQDRAAH